MKHVLKIQGNRDIYSCCHSDIFYSHSGKVLGVIRLRPFNVPNMVIFTARKRSLGQGDM